MLGCLQSLVEHPPSIPWEAIVVDNGSTDCTTRSVGSRAPWVRIIANRDNRGLPAANNQGIAASTGRYVLIANPDTEFSPHAVDALIDVLDRHPRAAFAVPRLHNPDGSLQVSAGDLPTLREALLGRQHQKRHRAVDSGFWWDGWAHDVERRIGRGHEACYLVRRAAIADIGLQDEAFRLDWEGIDWTARARSHDWEVWFTPKATVEHIGGVSIRQAPMRWMLQSHRGMYRYFAKQSSPSVRPFLAMLITVRWLLKTSAALLGVGDAPNGYAGP